MPMTLDQVRAYALGLPETTEEPHHDMSSFRVKGKIFVTVPNDQRLHVFVSEDDIRAAAAEKPKAFEEVYWGKKLSGLGVNLRHAARREVEELIEEAWRRKAPKKLAAAYDPNSRQ